MDDEEDPNMSHELQKERNSPPEDAHEWAGSSVPAWGLSPEELQDKKTKRKLNLQLTKKKLEAEERKAAAERSLVGEKAEAEREGQRWR
ncbi:hypothetical protein NDU88_005763 [Pleurodeles waltl]|uniref:Uncharacterized protein n=1 Tax=Pleurodeles waltl TaxID=8319 RepID=A0AAV7MXP0_PLEWA|nr:hypothetical protein NDU88_005763 [Pleurodeles waltl]